MPQGKGSDTRSKTPPTKVIDFTEAREEKLKEKRRENERVFFRNLLSAFFVTGKSQLIPIQLIEASEEGLSFNLSKDPSPEYNPSDPALPIRLYFSRDTYLEILVEIKNSRPCIEDGQRFTRYGCLIDRTLQSYPAFQLFVKFMKEYSQQSHRDMGDVSAFYR